MKILYNHRANQISASLLLSHEAANEIIDCCKTYYDKLAASVIMEKIMNDYGINGCIFASYVIGQLVGACKSDSTYKLKLLCQSAN